MEGLGWEGRSSLLLALLAQEICTFPPGDRAGALEDVIDDLPGILRATEKGMRQALVENAKDDAP
jgi:hypothetical protein